MARPSRALPPDLTLSRPLLLFSRSETSLISQQLGMPLWLDGSNSDPRFSRNRVRHEVLPVLEQLHPGAGRRISGVAERLAQEQDNQQQLLGLALDPLTNDNGSLNRRRLMALQPANQRQLLQLWLEQQGLPLLPAHQLEALLARLAISRPPGRSALQSDHWLRWDRQELWLER